VFAIQCLWSRVTGPQDRSPSLAVGALSWKEKENSDVSVCEERWFGVKYLTGEMENEDEETALYD